MTHLKDLELMSIQKKYEGTDPTLCPECQGKLVTSRSDLVCSECGLVIDKIYQHGLYSISNSEYNKTTNSKQYVSIGKKIESVDGLGSYIGFFRSRYFYDNNRKPLPPKNQILFQRLKKTYDFKARIKNRETDYRILSILNKITSYLKLQKEVQERAAYIYQKIKSSEKKIRNHVSLIAFCLFIAIRKFSQNAPINIREIVDIFQEMGHRVSPRMILRNGTFYKKYLNSNCEPHKSEDYFGRLLNGISNLEGFQSRLERKGFIMSVAQYKIQLTRTLYELSRKLTPQIRGGRNPFILAGAMIYSADKILAKRTGNKPVLTQKLTSKATGIAEYSIRDHYVSLLKPFLIQTYSF